MKRSEFFKRLGLGLAAAIAAPSVLAEIKEETFQDIIDADINGDQVYGSIYKDVWSDNRFHSWYKGKVTGFNTIYTNSEDVKIGDVIYAYHKNNDSTVSGFRAVVTDIQQVPYLAIKYRSRYYVNDDRNYLHQVTQLRNCLIISPYKKEQLIRGQIDFVKMGTI